MQLCDDVDYDSMKKRITVSRALRKLGIMHVRKVLSQISLCSPHRLIRDDTFRFYGIFSFKEVPPYRKSSLGGKCRP